MSGCVLLSHTVTSAVPSALKGLASGFGMEPGVSPSPWPPKRYGDMSFRLAALRARHISAQARKRNNRSRPYLGNRTVDAGIFLLNREG